MEELSDYLPIGLKKWLSYHSVHHKEPTTSNKKAKTKTHGEKTKMKRQTEYKEIYSDKGKTRGQKEVEQMKGTREMSNEERKQSKKKQKKEERQDDTHRNIT